MGDGECAPDAAAGEASDGKGTATTTAPRPPSKILAESELGTCAGEYSLTSTVHNGRPVWKKAAEESDDENRFLYFSSEENTWFINDDIFEDEGYDRAVNDVDAPLGLRWLRGKGGGETLLEAKGGEGGEGAGGSENAEALPSCIVVRGELETCNGEYRLSPDVHNERRVWKREAQPERFLFYSIEDKTWYISDDLEDQGFTQATTNVDLPFGLRWMKDTALRAAEEKGEAETDVEMGSEERSTAPERIFAEGPEAGEYALTSTTHDGRAVWKRDAEPRRLLFFSRPDTRWYIGEELGVLGFEQAEAFSALPLGLQWEKGTVLVSQREKEEREGTLTAVRDVVAEIRQLKSEQSGGESEEYEMSRLIKEASVRLALALRAAQSAGVPQADLLVASGAAGRAESTPPEAEELRIFGGWREGEKIMIVGLESEQGKQLNGNTGLVVGFLEDTGRVQIELDGGKTVSAKPSNLQIPILKVGNKVVVFGLESESGAKLNGRTGTIVEHIADKERFKVEFVPGETPTCASVRAVNLRRPAPPANGGTKRPARSPSSDSSSSASSGKPKKKKQKGFSSGKSGKVKQNLTPEEKMEVLLGNLPPESKKRPKKPKDEDPADVAAAAARAEGARAAQAAASHAAAAAMRPDEPLKPGDSIEVFGLKSAAGKALNGKTGLITKWDQAKQRFQVELGQANTQSLKVENLRRKRDSAAGGGAFASSYVGPSAGYTML